MTTPVSPDMAHWIDANTVRLFRYSALTCNPHRIHYDRDYAVQQEGYAGLVVAGPLIARLLGDLLMAHLPVRELKTFSCRAIAPLFDGPIHLRAHDSADEKKAPNCGRRTVTDVWACRRQPPGISRSDSY